MAALLGLDAVKKELLEAVDLLEKEAVAELKTATNVGFETMLANTPVWSGESVANYHAGTGEGEGHVEPTGEQPPKQRTNSLPLGAENNRGPNENLARQSLNRAVNGLKKLADISIYSTLNAAKADMIDNGDAPTPGSARNKGGVTKMAQQTVRARGNWR